MGMLVAGTVAIDDEFDCAVEADDEDIIDYVLENPQVLAALMDAYEPQADSWAKAFADADSVAQEQMLANLRLLCPYLNIEWKK